MVKSITIQMLPTKLKIGVRGNPNFGLVRQLMVGIKNNTIGSPTDPTGRSIKGEVWFNELRLSEMDNSGGMAAL
jgi:cell surface protein SprA